MKKAYIILSFTGTNVSRLIKIATRAEYSHASIALNPYPNQLYSFGRRKLHNFLVSGFLNEDTKKHVLGLFPHAPCAVYELSVSDESYRKMEMMISECNRHYDDYKYSFIGVFTSFFGIKKRLKHHYTCAQFVAMLLYVSDAVKLPKHPSLMKPMDFLKIPALKRVYKGELSKLSFGTDSPA